MKKLLTLFFVIVMFLSSNPLFAQQSRVDTLISLIEKANTKNGIDTTVFLSLFPYLGKIVLTDTIIARIETAGNKLIKGGNEDLSYLIKVFILFNLSESNVDKSIIYGKKLYEKLAKSQGPNADILKSTCFRQLRIPYRNSRKFTEGFQYYNEKLNEFKLKNDSLGLTDTYYILGGFFSALGLVDQAIYNMRKSLSYSNTRDDYTENFFSLTKGNGKILSLNNRAVLSNFYINNQDYSNASTHANRVLLELKNLTIPPLVKRFFSASMLAHANKALAELMMNKLDSVEYLLTIATEEAKVTKFYDHVARHLLTRAMYKMKLGKLDEAELHIKECWEVINRFRIIANAPAGVIVPDYYLAEIRIQQKRYPEAITSLIKNLARVNTLRLQKLKSYKLLADIYKKVGNSKQAAETYEKYISLQDSLLTDQKKYGYASFELEQQMSAKEKSILELQNQGKINSLVKNFSISIAALLLLLVTGVFARYQSKQKANKILEKTLTELKQTQTQLIQKEKLASLGELTAGIAHEIQNPLNFVNNFSEVSTELVKELEEERQKGDERDEGLEADLLGDLQQNLQKITHHGYRASSIVKGMLEHSRASTGERQSINLNTLVEEYLRLAYQGMRAKDKTFNTELKTDFAPNLGVVEVVTQDIGRVLLNLYNNAFYAVQQKQKRASSDYQPTVTVSTSQVNGSVEIRVRDNGTGIPDAVKTKIFQPFFTTKPTGEGTGLGLSLSYDIVTKGHGGTLTVESVKGEGTVFIIRLPPG